MPQRVKPATSFVPPRLDSDDVQAAAMSWAWSGFPVFPLRPGSKIPMLKGGCHAASIEIQDIVSIWGRYPTANVGVATGHGFAVVDIDPRHGGTVDPRLPDTFTVATPSGGVHLYYATEEDIPNSAGRLAPGVDVRGRGGHVVVAPSWTLVGGARQRWRVEAARHIAEMPRWLANECLAVAPATLGGERSTPGRRFNPADRISEGGRNDYMARYVGWALAQGVPSSEIEAEAHNENEYTCAPPLPREEVERVVANIARLHRARHSGTGS